MRVFLQKLVELSLKVPEIYVFIQTNLSYSITGDARERTQSLEVLPEKLSEGWMI